MIWFLVWLLCVLDGTNLQNICLVFLMVGHTHDALDRFFSKIVMALRGKSWITPEDMLDIIKTTLRWTTVRSGHLASVWAWKELLTDEGSPAKEISNLRCVHHLELQRTEEGVRMRWKQWMTDTEWSHWYVVCPRSAMASFASLRPSQMPMQFKNAASRLAWID